MNKLTDIRPIGVELFFLPVQTRVPLKFGPEVLTHVTCARVRMKVADRSGRVAEGWGETPLSVQWAWPSQLPYETRHTAMKQFCVELARAWAAFDSVGHPLEVGYDFLENQLPTVLREFNASAAQTFQSAGPCGFPVAGTTQEPMPWLAALICCSAFDQALHDAFGQLLDRPTYSTYGAEFMFRSLSDFITPAPGSDACFQGKTVQDFLLPSRLDRLPAWHLVGGLDPLEPADLNGSEPKDGYPVLLREWIQRDGLACLKIKLRGNDSNWDYQRIVKVGTIALETGVDSLSADFNCTVTDPEYVNEILDRLQKDHSAIFKRILYVEQPFPYELEKHRIDVGSLSGRKPLFLDESAHDWRLIQLGRELGWTGVALKTCKTQTGALLSACWAKAHGMQLMVQDLTNPMLAQIPHVLLAAHVGTIRGVETNAMQFYPEASNCEAKVHPGIYRRRSGIVDLATVSGPGFGYRLQEISRELPQPVAQFGI